MFTTTPKKSAKALKDFHMVMETKETGHLLINTMWDSGLYPGTEKKDKVVKVK